MVSPLTRSAGGVDYERAEYPGKNTSGIRVFGCHVLIKTDQCAKQTSGGILIIDESLDRKDAASISGCIFVVGDNAFKHHADGTPWRGAAPTVGDRVFFAQYAGDLVPGRDGSVYRIVEDGCISGKMLDEDEDSE